jgi:hypothetical protein
MARWASTAAPRSSTPTDAMTSMTCSPSVGTRAPRFIPRRGSHRRSRVPLLQLLHHRWRRRIQLRRRLGTRQRRQVPRQSLARGSRAQYLGKQLLRGASIETFEAQFGDDVVMDKTYLYDLMARYRWSNSVLLFGGIQNLTDEKPFITEFSLRPPVHAAATCSGSTYLSVSSFDVHAARCPLPAARCSSHCIQRSSACCIDALAHA